MVNEAAPHIGEHGLHYFQRNVLDALAGREASPFHDVAREWWTGCLNGAVSVWLCHPVVFAFVRICTNRRAFEHPLSLGQVTGIDRSRSDRQVTRMLNPGPRHARNVLELLAAAGTHGGDLVTDAQIAELAIAHRAEVHTADHDFRRFRGLSCRFPLDV